MGNNTTEVADFIVQNCDKNDCIDWACMYKDLYLKIGNLDFAELADRLYLF
jgi:transcriptional antiterminator Rof (Rho-off)